MTESSEIPSGPETDICVLQKEKPILIGKSNEPIEGFEVFCLDEPEVADNRYFSRYGVQILLRGDDRVIVSRPNLTINGENYVSRNRIVVVDKNNEKKDVSNEYDAGVGGKNLQSLFVGDKNLLNGFGLSMGENNQIKLEVVTVNGKDL